MNYKVILGVSIVAAICAGQAIAKQQFQHFIVCHCCGFNF